MAPSEKLALETAVRQSLDNPELLVFYSFDKFGAGWLCRCNRSYEDLSGTKYEYRCVFLILSYGKGTTARVVWSKSCSGEGEPIPQFPGSAPARLTATERHAIAAAQVMWPKTDDPSFVLSVEPADGPTFVHGFHLGTQEPLARQIAKDQFTVYTQSRPIRTVALMRGRKIVDVWNGEGWASQDNWEE